MTNLPIFQSIDSKSFSLLQTSWKAAILPVLNNEINQGLQLGPVALSSGVNFIPHLLGRKMVGWIISDKDGDALIHRSAPLNDTILTLTSSASCNISLWVY